MISNFLRPARCPALILILLNQAGATLGAQEPKQKVALEGTVIDSASDQPLPGARISCGPASGMSSDSGQFVLTAEDGTSCDLKAVLSGYSVFSPGILRMNFSKVSEESKIRIVMSRLGSISGNVAGPNRMPAVGAKLILAQKWSVGSKIVLRMRAETKTNNQGDYRFENLAPGTYFVLAHQAPLEANSPDPQPTSTFYPSSSDVESATPIVLRSGQNVIQSNIELMSARRFRLFGKIVGLGKDDDASKLVRLILRPCYTRSSEEQTALEGGQFSAAARTIIQPDGIFELRGVPPGQYHLNLNFRNQINFGPRVEVIDKDVEKLFLEIRPAYPATISVQMDNLNTQIQYPVPLSLLALGSSFATIPFHVREDGSEIKLAALPAGKYALDFWMKPQTLYVKSLDLNGRPADPGGFEISGFGEAQIKVSLSSKVAFISGSVAEPDSRVTITPMKLLPIELSFQMGVVGLDGQGAFAPVAVRPGEYFVCAWRAPIEQVVYVFPDERFGKEISKDCEKIAVEEGTRASVRLRKAIRLE